MDDGTSSSIVAFVGHALALQKTWRFGACKSRRYLRNRNVSQNTSSVPVMIQSPDSDGPPDLDGYFANLQLRQSVAAAPPITLGTGRANKSAHDGNDSDTVAAAVRAAISALSAVPQLCHVTMALDFDPESVSKVLSAELGNVPFMGRTVNKKGGEGLIEVLLLSSEAGSGIQISSHTETASVESIDNAVAIDTDDIPTAIDNACKAAIQNATSSALEKLPPENPPLFLLYAHSVGARTGVARNAISGVAPGCVPYGGSAAADEQGWVVLGPGVDASRSSDVNTQTAVVAAVPGSISYLLSSVVKNWAQPKFTEALSFMTPNYVGNPDTDLLTAIRYDDWHKFIYCLEEAKVPVNTKWAKKQNQIPLLAACARLRLKMVSYLIEHGADVHHRNDGGFTAAMYTRMLTEHEREVVEKQLAMLENAGANITLTEDEVKKLTTATNGRIVL